jgi:error-prone DNA polymerase
MMTAQEAGEARGTGTPAGGEGRGSRRRARAGAPAAVAYAELCAASNFTFLTGASHPEELVTRAADLGLAAIAIADRNSLAGVVRAHVALRELARARAEAAAGRVGAAGGAMAGGAMAGGDDGDPGAAAGAGTGSGHAGCAHSGAVPVAADRAEPLDGAAQRGGAGQGAPLPLVGREGVGGAPAGGDDPGGPRRLSDIAAGAPGTALAVRSRAVRHPDAKGARVPVRSHAQVDPSSRQDFGRAEPLAVTAPALPRLIVGARLVLADSPVEWVALPRDRAGYALGRQAAGGEGGMPPDAGRSRHPRGLDPDRAAA